MKKTKVQKKAFTGLFIKRQLPNNGREPKYNKETIILASFFWDFFWDTTHKVYH